MKTALNVLKQTAIKTTTRDQVIKKAAERLTIADGLTVAPMKDKEKKILKEISTEPFHKIIQSLAKKYNDELPSEIADYLRQDAVKCYKSNKLLMEKLLIRNTNPSINCTSTNFLINEFIKSTESNPEIIEQNIIRSFFQYTVSSGNTNMLELYYLPKDHENKFTLKNAKNIPNQLFELKVISQFSRLQTKNILEIKNKKEFILYQLKTIRELNPNHILTKLFNNLIKELGQKETLFVLTELNEYLDNKTKFENKIKTIDSIANLETINKLKNFIFNQ